MRCPPCSGETTNRKCLFASIFLNVNCESREVKRDRRSQRLSESHPQSYCSLAENDAKHSLKPIYVSVQTPERIEPAEFRFRLCPYCVFLKQKMESCVALTPSLLCCFSFFFLARLVFVNRGHCETKPLFN